MNRLFGVLLGQAREGEEKLFMARGWAVAVLFYLVFAFTTTMLPWPRFGLTREVVASLHLPGSGLWVSEPHRVMAFGALYYLATAVSELFDHRWLPASGLPEAARSTSS